jgi:hypothetical protein
LTYAYAASEVVVTAVGDSLDPGAYTLCATHLSRLQPPQGWHMIDHMAGPIVDRSTAVDAMAALAAEIRRIGGFSTTSRGLASGKGEPSLSRRDDLVVRSQRAHMRLVMDTEQARDSRS